MVLHLCLPWASLEDPWSPPRGAGSPDRSLEAPSEQQGSLTWAGPSAVPLAPASPQQWGQPGDRSFPFEQHLRLTQVCASCLGGCTRLFALQGLSFPIRGMEHSPSEGEVDAYTSHYDTRHAPIPGGQPGTEAAQGGLCLEPTLPAPPTPQAAGC